MYIEDRLFSESYPEEVLFSVLMTEEEYDLYSEFQKEFSVSKLGSTFRHLKRDASRVGTQIKAGAKMGMGKDLTAKEVHEIAANQRMATRFGKTAYLHKISPEQATKSAQAWTKIDHSGKGATSFLGGYIRK